MAEKSTLTRKIHRCSAALMVLAAGVASAHPGHGESNPAHLHGVETAAAIVAFSALLWVVNRAVKQKALAKSSSTS